MNDVNDEPVPWDFIAPLLAWMVKHNVTRVRVVATAVPEPATEEPARDESRNLLYCEAEPGSQGLLNSYVVADEHGQGRLNGPTRVPQDLLRPLLRALDEASVSELLVAAEGTDGAGEASAITTTVAAPMEDIEEHEIPPADNWPPPVLSVQVRDV